MEKETVLTYLDGYCERAGDPSLWGEPLNAITNIAFIVAAILAANALHKTPNIFKVDLWLLVAMLLGIGIGSGAWHLIPNGHTVLMDVLPITLFINIYLVAALRRILELPRLMVGALWLAYAGASYLAQIHLPPDTLNGTIMYIPTFATLVLLTIAIKMRDPVLGKTFVKVLFVWALSLTFRTIDPEICTQFPYGTHFLWHVLNAWVLWKLLTTLIAHAVAKAR